jgi:hypothetical protein
MSSMLPLPHRQLYLFFAHVKEHLWAERWILCFKSFSVRDPLPTLASSNARAIMPISTGASKTVIVKRERKEPLGELMLL